MGREDRQDINKVRKAGSDLPPRGEGVKDVKLSVTGEPPVTAAIIRPKPKGYKGAHRDRG
jgi:hypothetical protein